MSDVSGMYTEGKWAFMWWIWKRPKQTRGSVGNKWEEAEWESDCPSCKHVSISAFSSGIEMTAGALNAYFSWKNEGNRTKISNDMLKRFTLEFPMEKASWRPTCIALSNILFLVSLTAKLNFSFVLRASLGLQFIFITSCQTFSCTKQQISWCLHGDQCWAGLLQQGGCSHHTVGM